MSLRRRGLVEGWPRRGTHRVKPTADVHLGAGEPVARVAGHDSADFTFKFPQRCRGFFPDSSGWSPLLRLKGLSRIWRQHRQLADLLPLPRAAKVDGMIRHRQLGNRVAASAGRSCIAL